MKRIPTPEQQTAIKSDANKIAISASAGSGKTTTMIDRIVHILQIGNSRLDQLLVLTFTDASAKDMRKKLKQQLGDKVTPVALQAAAIGTFHSFCANVVRAWFSVAGVNPSFTVLDAVPSLRLKTTIFDKIIREHYDEARLAIDLFAATRTLDGLRTVVFTIYEFLTTRHQPEQWLHEVALTAYQPDLDQNPAIQALIKFYREQALQYRQAFIDLQHQSPQVDFVIQLATQISQCMTYASFQKLDLTFPTLKKEPDFVLYEDFKTLRNDFRDHLCKNITKQFSFPETVVQADILAERKVVTQLLFLVEKFAAAYGAQKLENNKLDFADLEKYALIVLRNPEAAAAIRGQFKYIFVDEGQDTNPVQFQIIDLLRGDDKFFYIVGDVKQSIYGFRGCEPEMFASMIRNDLVQALRLNKNFRSTVAILHFVNQVMTPLIRDYQTEHQFVLPTVPKASLMQKAVHIELADNLAAEMELLYQQIVQSGRPLAQIAILSETATHFKALQKYLAARGIPSVIDRATNALDEPEIVLLNNFLFAVLNPTNELAKYLTLQYLFDCSNDDLARIRLGKLTPAVQKKLTAFETTAAQYRSYARTMATDAVMTMAATQFKMLEIPAVAAFLVALRGVKDFDSVARYLYLLEHQLLNIQINVGTQVTDAVKIMTIHSSKGLEFPMVLLFNLGALWSQHHDNNQIALDKDLGVCVVSVDTENYVQKSPVLRLGILKYQQQQLLDEKKRLLYVALTRAKEYLYLVGCWERKTTLMSPNCMMDLINPLAAVHRSEVVASPEKKIDAGTKATTPQKANFIGHSQQLIKQSVTALAAVDQQFQEHTDYVAPVKYDYPGGKDFGTAYHRQLQYGALPDAVAKLVAGYTLYKELPFLYREQQTIVQGIMDLLAVKDQEAIIVDYKTTRLPETQLVAKYREQLRLYAQALPDYQVRTYIYSTVHKKLIVVSAEM